MSEALERRLGRVLTVGTRLSTAVLAFGLAAVTFALPGSPHLAHALLTAGLLVLLLTPVARVAVSVVGYVGERDWWFVLYTGIVLALAHRQLRCRVRLTKTSIADARWPAGTSGKVADHVREVVLGEPIGLSRGRLRIGLRGRVVAMLERRRQAAQSSSNQATAA